MRTQEGQAGWGGQGGQWEWYLAKISDCKGGVLEGVGLCWRQGTWRGVLTRSDQVSSYGHLMELEGPCEPTVGAAGVPVASSTRRSPEVGCSLPTAHNMAPLIQPCQSWEQLVCTIPI